MHTTICMYMNNMSPFKHFHLHKHTHKLVLAESNMQFKFKTERWWLNKPYFRSMSVALWLEMKIVCELVVSINTCVNSLHWAFFDAFFLDSLTFCLYLSRKKFRICACGGATVPFNCISRSVSINVLRFRIWIQRRGDVSANLWNDTIVLAHTHK